MAEKNSILEEITVNSARLGDLPIFSATLNHIQKVTSDPESDAMDLADEVLKDASLSTKLLRLANTRHYNRGVGKIGTASRAVVLLGFDTVKNVCLTLKMLDGFKKENQSPQLQKLLINSYMTASFVKELAEQADIKDVEQTYISGLLHNLGEIMVAYFLPEKYDDIIQTMDTNNLSWKESQKQVLGIELQEVSKELAKQWEFPLAIIETMDDFDPRIESYATNKNQLNQALSSLATEVMSTMYGNKKKTDLNYPDLINSISEVAGIKVSKIEKCLSTSFKRACDLSDEYGLDKKALKPVINESNDELRDEVARKLSYYTVRSDEDLIVDDLDTQAVEDVIPSNNTPSSGQEKHKYSREDKATQHPEQISPEIEEINPEDFEYPFSESIDIEPDITKIEADDRRNLSGQGPGNQARSGAKSSKHFSSFRNSVFDNDRHSSQSATNKKTKHPPAHIAEKQDLTPAATEQKSEAREATSVSPDENKILQLEILQEITSLISVSFNLQTIFAKVLDGIQKGVGFDRAMLALLSKDRKIYSGRLARGKNSADVKNYFDFRVNPNNDLFSRILLEGNEMLVTNIHDEAFINLIRKDFSKKTHTDSFAIAALKTGGKPIGFFYADKGLSKNPISQENFDSFMQFVNQARLALQFSELTNNSK